jgi:hypothetical protein
MGPRGQKILKDIAYPGKWSVLILHEHIYDRFRITPEEFRDLCKFKWAFNIKPDMVLVIPDCKPICVEAKLESAEGRYPIKAEECSKFDRLFKDKKRRVRQIELQQFMFKYLLKSPCQSVVIGQAPADEDHGPVSLGWDEVFRQMNMESSLSFVRKFIEKNQYLHR